MGNGFDLCNVQLFVIKNFIESITVVYLSFLLDNTNTDICFFITR